MARINYTSTVGDGYAMSNEFDYNSDRVAQSIARKRGLHVCAGPRGAGADMRAKSQGYEMTLGRPVSTGGFSPVEVVYFWIDFE